jgi:methylglutamate dehydrogenase subunit D
VAELTRQNPWRTLMPVGQGAGVLAAAIENCAIATVLARKGKIAELAGRLRTCFEIELNDRPKRIGGNGVTFLGIGPGKWLAMSAQPRFVVDLAAKLEGLASVVEQSDALAILELSGPALPATLEKGFQIDLGTFAIDDCAVTSVNHLGATIWKTRDECFEVAIFRSFVGSFLHWLGESAAASGLAVKSDQGRTPRATENLRDSSS